MKDTRYAGIIAFGFMVVLAAFTIWGTMNMKGNETEAVAMDVSGDERITEASKLVNGKGKVVGYTVSASAPGFYQSPIKISLTLKEDGVTIKDITVDASQETSGVGTKVQETEFTSTLIGKTGPFKITGSEGNGTEIDAVSQATVSSTAAITCINTALEFIQNNQ